MTGEPTRCPRCGRENRPGGVFCIFCGLPLTSASQPGTPLPGSTPGAPSDLEEELRQIRRALISLTDRVAALEVGRLSQLLPSAPPPQAPAEERPGAAAATEPAAAAATPESEAPGPERSVAEQPAEPPSMSAGALEPGFGAQIPSTEAQAGAGEGGGAGGAGARSSSFGFDIDWEHVLARNWFVIIGAVALAIGIGFFLRLAFQNNWIGETGRIALGIAAGVALLAAGEYAERRVPFWAQAVSGAGLAVLYLAVYAAFWFYHLIPPVPAFLFLAMVVGLSGLLALRYESLVIVLLGIGGAFATPLLLAREIPAEQRYLVLLYLILVDAGILGVSTFRNWRWLTLLGLVASYVLFGMFTEEVTARELLGVQVALTVVFLIFVGATTLFHVVWRRAPGLPDMALMSLNAVAYFGVSYGLLWERYQVWFGALALSLSFFYGLVGYGAIRRTGAPPQVALFSLATALIYLTLAVPLQMSGHWISIAWAAQGMTLVWVGFYLRSWPARAFGLAVLSLGVFRALVFDTLLYDTQSELQTFRLVFNDRFPTFAAVVVALSVTAYLYHRERGRLQEWERYVVLALAGAANFLALWGLSAEVISYFEREAMLAVGGGQVFLNAKNYQALALTSLWALYAGGLLVVALGNRSQILRWAGLALLSLPVAKLLLIDTVDVDLDPRGYLLVVNVYFLTAVLVDAMVALAAYVYRRLGTNLTEPERYAYPALLVTANLLAIWALSVETNTFFNTRAVLVGSFEALEDAENDKQMVLTVLWTLYAAGLLGVALWKGFPPLRWAGLGLLFLPAAKLMMYDTVAVNLDPTTYWLALNPLFAVSLLILAALVFAAYVYQRQVADLAPWERAANVYPALLVGANAFALFALSAEAVRFFDYREIQLETELRSAKHLTLTILWAVYALLLIVTGIARRSRPIRLFGVALLAVPVAKLFVFDVFLLEHGYRVAAFIILGVFLLGVGLAYQRYSRSIRGFLFEKV